MSDSNYTITGVKAFGDYSLTNIVGITIPVGIANVNITTNNTSASVKQITFGTGMVGTVTSLKGLTSLETIVIENVADLEFKRECAPKTVKSIKSDISGANVEYAEGAFLGYTNLTEMTFSSGSTYVFGKQSFKESGVKSLNFVDNCKVDFKGEQAFYASKLEYLYVGKGITTLANNPEVHFAGIRVSVQQRSHECAYAFPVAPCGCKRAEYAQSGKLAGIAVDEIAEIVVSRQLTAADRRRLAQQDLGVRMAHSAHHRREAGFPETLDRRPACAHVMNDSPALFERLCHDGDQIIRLDELTPLVHEHRTVRIAIEYDAAVQPPIPDQGGNLRPGFGFQRIRTVMREVPVRNVVDYDGVREEAPGQNPGGAIAAVDGEPEP